jgi:hypothetical protein
MRARSFLPGSSNTLWFWFWRVDYLGGNGQLRSVSSGWISGSSGSNRWCNCGAGVLGSLSGCDREQISRQPGGLAALNCVAARIVALSMQSARNWRQTCLRSQDPVSACWNRVSCSDVPERAVWTRSTERDAAKPDARGMADCLLCVRRGNVDDL